MATETSDQTRADKWEWGRALNRAHDLNLAQRGIAHAMSCRDNNDGRGFYASGQHLAEELGVNRRTIVRALEKLVAAGWITQTKRGGRHGDVARASEYILTIPIGADTPHRETSEDDTQRDTVGAPLGQIESPEGQGCPTTRPELTRSTTRSVGDQEQSAPKEDPWEVQFGPQLPPTNAWRLAELREENPGFEVPSEIGPYSLIDRSWVWIPATFD